MKTCRHCNGVLKPSRIGKWLTCTVCHRTQKPEITKVTSVRYPESKYDLVNKAGVQNVFNKGLEVLESEDE